MKVIGHIAVDTAVFGICETFAKIVWSSGTAASAGSSTSSKPVYGLERWFYYKYFCIRVR